MGFILEFRFAPNNFFSNEVLTKEYSGSVNKVGTSPPSFDFPVINNSKGCAINWFPGMDPSYRMVNMQQTNQATKLNRVIAKPVKMKTFFNFFSPPTLPEDARVDLKPEYLASITRDYEIGLYFREEVIPNAYLFFTAQIVEKDDNFVDVQILPDRPAPLHPH
uniref:Nucleosome assembly protein 1-like 1 n=1 Tax=Lygus hesperus TaxID=30085 RepID=A0A0A9WGN8_LYGHE